MTGNTEQKTDVIVQKCRPAASVVLAVAAFGVFATIWMLDTDPATTFTGGLFGVCLLLLAWVGR